jgi:hypothetical protein
MAGSRWLTVLKLFEAVLKLFVTGRDGRLASTRQKTTSAEAQKTPLGVSGRTAEPY